MKEVVRVFQIETDTHEFVADGEVFSFFVNDRHLKLSLYKKCRNGRRQQVCCSTTDIGIAGISENGRTVDYLAHQIIRAMVKAYQNGVKAGFDRAGSQQ